MTLLLSPLLQLAPGNYLESCWKTENIQWARMKMKPNKSRSISIIKGELKNVK